MTRSDLKTGMQVETRCGERYVVLNGTKCGQVFCQIGKTGSMNNIQQETLKNPIVDSYDIMRVFESWDPKTYISRKMEDDCIIWERVDGFLTVTKEDVAKKFFVHPRMLKFKL